MKLSASKGLVLLTVVVVALVATAAAGAKSDRTVTGGSLTGAGSTFVFPLMSQWIAGYQAAAGVTVTYGSVGSGAGIAQITARTVDFGASDAPFTPSQQSACDAGPPASTCVQIPWAVSGTAVDYNVPGVPQHIKLTGPVIAEIYLGQITNWNDPAIAALNPGVTFPTLAITPIYRSDGSGTTYNFTQYLSAVSPAFSAKVGVATSVSFPVGVGGKGSSGVAGVLSQTSGGIAYTDVAYAVQSHFQTARSRTLPGSGCCPATPTSRRLPTRSRASRRATRSRSSIRPRSSRPPTRSARSPTSWPRPTPRTRLCCASSSSGR